MKNLTSQSEPVVPARRLESVKEYYFSKKLKEIAKMNAEGAGIISLGVGGPDRPPHADVIETLCRESLRSENHGYQPYVGLSQLREAYADWYFRHYSVALNPDCEIQPLIGSKEGILHTTLAFVNPGDGVLVPNPGYPTYSSVSRLAEAEIFTYNLLEENGWLPDFDELERLPLDKIKLMWVNYPNMPTGATATIGLFERLVDFGKRHGIVIVNDNPYSFILHEKPLSIFQVNGAKEIAIEMNSMSKSHNMAGWRMGMLASNRNFIEWILKVKSNVDSGQFKPMMLAAVKALDAPDSWYAEINKEYASRRKIAEKIMEALGCSFSHEQGGLFLWGRIPDDVECAESLTEKVLHGAGVFITPGFIFGSNGERYIRISLCADEDTMREALHRINNLVNK